MDLLSVLTVVFSGVVAYSTFQYAKLTKSLVTETKKMREAQTTPNVLVTIEPEEFDLYLVVRNVGLAPAYDIKFNINPDIEPIEKHPLSTVGFIKNGLSILAPGQEIKTLLLAPLFYKFKEQINTILDIKVMYKDISEEQITEGYQIDLSQFEGTLTVTSQSSYENTLLKAIQDIGRAIEKINDQGLRAAIYNSIAERDEDYNKYWREIMEEANREIKEFKTKNKKEKS